MNYKAEILKALRDITVVALGIILAAALTYGSYIAKDKYHEITRPLTEAEKCDANPDTVWIVNECMSSLIWGF